jgi:hypothetical protein
MAADPAKRRATYDDLRAVPANLVVWLAHPTERTLEVLRLDGPSYRLDGVFGGDERARIPPFDAIEFDVGALWMR